MLPSHLAQEVLSTLAESGIEARRRAALKEGSAPYLARREEIVQAAAGIFRQQGYESATLLDVAKVLGTDRASLYYYVGSKEDLLQQIVRNALERALDEAETIYRSRASAPDKIKAFIASMVSNYADNYPHMSIYIEDLRRIAHEDSEWAIDVIDRTRRYEKLVRTTLEKGQRAGSFRTDMSAQLVTLSLFGMINWMHRWYRPGHKDSPDEIADTFARIFLSGCSN